MIKVDVALVHYPVCNKNQEVIGSAVTNLDIHDIARASRTFGVDNYYIVTPYADQQVMVAEILDHWLYGHGARYNAKLKDALELVTICDDLTALYAMASQKSGTRPTVLATCASEQGTGWTYDEARSRIAAGEHVLLLFGTGWGLTAEVLQQVDVVLPPILGAGQYNHLSVRSAVAIILDRLLGNR